jgi:hypothetical protein
MLKDQGQELLAVSMRKPPSLPPSYLSFLFLPAPLGTETNVTNWDPRTHYHPLTTRDQPQMVFLAITLAPILIFRFEPTSQRSTEKSAPASQVLGLAQGESGLAGQETSEHSSDAGVANMGMGAPAWSEPS